jgi:hypothetical protein
MKHLRASMSIPKTADSSTETKRVWSSRLRTQSAAAERCVVQRGEDLDGPEPGRKFTTLMTLNTIVFSNFDLTKTLKSSYNSVNNPVNLESPICLKR